jgi:sugar lactone lactonase YvrE
VAVDSRGYVYVTSALSVEGESPKLFRVDPAGQVSVFAGETQSLDGPFGLAIDHEDNVFVANLETVFFSSFVLKFDPSGAASRFASDLSTVIRSMTFDADGNLFATLDSVQAIMKFTPTGDQSVFADATDGINFPMAIRSCAG